MKGYRLCVAIVIAAWTFGLAALAQTTGGSLEGRVADQAGQPVIGALVQVSGPSLQGWGGGATDSAGQYNIPYLPPGRDYEVAVEAPGYGKVIRKGITIPLNCTVNLPFTLSQGQTEITVTAAASVVDPKSTQTGSTLSSNMIQSIPLQRDSNGIVFLAPGAVDGGSSTPGMASIGGSTGAENTYLVNGMNVTNTNYGTGTGVTGCNCQVGLGTKVVAGAVIGSMLNFDFIQDMQIMTGGVPPEYGDGMGGIVNAITRSGGNEFHGGLYAYYWSDALQAKSETYPWNSTFIGNAGYVRYDVGGNLSGYFVKDKLWFYVGYDYNRMKDYTDVPSGPGYGDTYLYLNGRPAQSAFAGQHVEDTSEINQQYAFKLTWSVNSSHKLALSLFGDQDKVDLLQTLATLAPESQPYATRTEPTNISLQWNATWTPKFFSEAVASYHDGTQKVTVNPVGAANLAYRYYYSGFYALPKDQTAPPVSADPNTGILDLGSNYQPSLGFGAASGIDKDTSFQFRVKFTNLLGPHELTYGLQYDDRAYTPRATRSGPTDFVSPGSGKTAIGGLGTGLWAPADWFGYPIGPGGQQYIYQVGESFTNPDHPAAMTTRALWINDNWAITRYFTLKLGLRYDEEKVEGKLPGAAAINLTGNYAPRLGFTWDVAHNSKSKLFGFAGRYFQRVPTQIGVQALNNYQSGYEWFYDPQLTVWTGDSYFFGGLCAIQGQTPGLPVESRLKAPYTDEYILGFDYEVLPDLRLGTRLIYRTLGRTVEDLYDYVADRYVIANPGDWTNVPVPGLNPDWTPNYNETYYYPKPTRIYRALEITADKRFSHNWQMGASYVLSRLDGNYEGQAQNDDPIGSLIPNINPAFDIPQVLVNGSGLLPLDRTHVFKAYGSYQFSNIPLEISANFALQSGTPISKLINLNWYSWGFSTTRGSAGRTPTTWSLDLGAQYNFKLPKSSVLGVRLDIFNVTNNQVATAVYQTWQIQYNPGGPLYMDNALWGKPYKHQPPRLVRLGLRWTF